MIAGVLLLAACAAGVAPPRDADGYARAMEALEAGEFGVAKEALDAETDPLLRQEGRARLHIAAGDPTVGLREAARGLEGEPGNLRLLHQACRGALWLSSDELASHYSMRLSRAVDEAGGALAPDEHAWWRDKAADYRAQARTLVELRAAREQASERAKWTSLGVLGLCGVALLVLGFRGTGP